MPFFTIYDVPSTLGPHVESASEKNGVIHPGTQMYGTQAEPELLRSGSATGGDSPGVRA